MDYLEMNDAQAALKLNMHTDYMHKQKDLASRAPYKDGHRQLL
jgi:hypothetical protein